ETHETNAAAMQASTAFPPSARTSAPACAVSGCPAATAPLIRQAYSASPARPPPRKRPRRQIRRVSQAASQAMPRRLPRPSAGAPRQPPARVSSSALAESQPARPRSASLGRRRGDVGVAAGMARAAGRRSRRARLPTDAAPPPRLRVLEQLLVRGPLQLRHLQPPLLPAGGAARDQAARGG